MFNNVHSFSVIFHSVLAAKIIKFAVEVTYYVLLTKTILWYHLLSNAIWREQILRIFVLTFFYLYDLYCTKLVTLPILSTLKVATVMCKIKFMYPRKPAKQIMTMTTPIISK